MTRNQRKLAFIDETSKQAPEYGSLLALFRGIFSYIDASQGETGISFAAELPHPSDKIQEGVPLISAETMTVDHDTSLRFLAGLVDAIAAESREGSEELGRIASAAQHGGLDLKTLLTACLRRDRAPLEAAAEEISVPSPLIEFVMETTLKAALEPFAARLTEAEFIGWQEGYCPVCGSRAGMGELAGEEGQRHLCCSTCFFRWPYRRLQCPYCGNDEPQTLSYLSVDDGPTRIDLCHNCSRFLKTRDSRKGHADVPLEAEDIATIHLDLVAFREGFERGK